MNLKFELDINKKIIILSSVTVMIAAVLGVLVIYPSYNSLIELTKNHYDQRVQLAIYQKQRSNLDETVREYNDIKSDINKITSVLLAKDDLPQFVDTLDTWAKQYELKQDLNLSNLEESLNSEKIIITLDLAGTWDNLISYMYELENSNYYIIIDNPQFVRNDNSINLKTKLAVYLR